MLNADDFSEEYSTRNFTRVEYTCDCTITHSDKKTQDGVINDISINGFKISIDRPIADETLIKITTNFKKSRLGILGKIAGVFSNNSENMGEYLCKTVHSDETGTGVLILKTNKSSFLSLIATVLKCGVDTKTIDKEIKNSANYIEVTDKF